MADETAWTKPVKSRHGWCHVFKEKKTCGQACPWQERESCEERLERWQGTITQGHPVAQLKGTPKSSGSTLPPWGKDPFLHLYLSPWQHGATLKERSFSKAAAIHPSSLAVHTGTTEESHSSFRYLKTDYFFSWITAKVGVLFPVPMQVLWGCGVVHVCWLKANSLASAHHSSLWSARLVASVKIVTLPGFG